MTDGARHDRAGVAGAVLPQREVPPAAPGPGASEWRCRCGNLLGFLDRGWLLARHRGRAITALLPARVQCEDCGRREVRMPPDAPAAAGDSSDAAD
jgi:hypothetical protein